MKRPPKLLVVDDGHRYIDLAHALLTQYRYAVRCERPGPCWTCDFKKGCTLTHAHDWSETQQALAAHPDVDVVLLDVVFDLPPERLLMRDDGDLERSRRLQGIEILKRLRRRFGNLPVVLMTSMEELQFEDAALRLAVDEFVTPAGSDAFDARAIGLLIERILARRAAPEDDTDYLFGTSTPMATLKRDAVSLARTSLPMLILGETGVGKSALVETVIHPASRRTGPLVTVDLAALPETLVAAELFGTVRGAFSGAVDRVGCIEQAEGGTLFLDEIGNLSEEVQRMLLVTLQSGRFSRLGESRPRSANIKLAAASNIDLEGAVRRGRFRADLYARLNPSARLTVPPLRERKDDIVSLLAFFVKKIFAHPSNLSLLEDYIAECGLQIPAAVRAATDAPYEQWRGVQFVIADRPLRTLLAHSFPGNIRELEMLTADMVLLSVLDALRAAEEGRAPHLPAAIPISAKLVRDLVSAPTAVGGEPADGENVMSFPIRPGATLRDTSRGMERCMLQTLFDRTGGDFEEMAVALLTGDPSTNARRVRLRFNQLGLRVRTGKQKSQGGPI